jgi:peptidoglycan/LPS O-acetylase OafA/YrhL
MNRRPHRWLALALAAAVLYLAAGIVFGTLAGAAGPTLTRTLWRATAFLFSGGVFVAHLAVEWKSRRVLASSLHVAAAVAIGAFGLALSANIHGLSDPSAKHFRLTLALVLWPLLTALPAFVVALAATTLGSRLPRRPTEAEPQPRT